MYVEKLRPHLSPHAQQIADLRLHFLFFILQRRRFWNNIYTTGESFKSEYNQTLLFPIVSIMATWLPSENKSQTQSLQVWKCWFRFPFEICIISSFEVLEFVWKNNDDIYIREQFRLVCERIIINLSQAEFLSPHAVKWLRKSWNEVCRMTREWMLKGKVSETESRKR